MRNLLKEGIWVIRKIKRGVHYQYVGTQLGELPNIMTKAGFEPYRNIIYKQLLKFSVDELGTTELTAKEILKIITTSIKK